ncbi:hypothetical protein DSO57_1004634 [Entomophthora muscae]|uniref:Uncharacterized protein n=1 Tax=Entomophthora muscae TaxID=34485 RepID=A0ACC2SLK6_9FUNG|nr:hypothetical protein DSO57_1004634 [Entomophthora muscae]
MEGSDSARILYKGTDPTKKNILPSVYTSQRVHSQTQHRYATANPIPNQIWPGEARRDPVSDRDPPPNPFNI